MTTYIKGDTYQERHDTMWTAGIHVGEHGNRIEVHGQTKEEAEALRDRTLAGLLALPERVA